MIFEGSCDTEDWSMADQIQHHRNKLYLKYIKTEKHNFEYIFCNINVFLYLWLSKCSLDEYKNFFKNIKMYTALIYTVNAINILIEYLVKYFYFWIFYYICTGYSIKKW